MTLCMSRVMDPYPGSSATDLWQMAKWMLRGHRERPEVQRKFVEEVTFEPDFLRGDEGESSCPTSSLPPHFSTSKQSGFSHSTEMLSSRASVTFLWQQ